MSEIESIFAQDYAALAPMSSMSDCVFRPLMIGFGARPVITGMISAEGLIRQKNRKTAQFLRFTEHERPLGIQLFGSSAYVMGEAARLCAEMRPDFIDLNFGCPVRKVVIRGSGCALMRTPAICGKIVAEVVRAVDVPVSVKIRSGWSQEEINAIEVARVVVSEGASAVIVHPRTRGEGFREYADWSVIADVVQAVNVPVIGNGDINTVEDAGRMLVETDCHSVMIGRAALTNPWVFSDIHDWLSARKRRPAPNPNLRLLLGLLQLRVMCREVGKNAAVKRMKRFFGWYTKGLSCGTVLRQDIFQAKNPDDVNRIIMRYLEQFDEEKPYPSLLMERMNENERWEA